jgi:hypothetical protein
MIERFCPGLIPEKEYNDNVLIRMFQGHPSALHSFSGQDPGHWSGIGQA